MNHSLQIFHLAFGLLTIVGGIIGYTSKKSVPSLVAGSILGLLLLAAAWLLPSIAGLVLGLVASLAIAGKFVPNYLRKKTLFPAGVMALLGIAGIAFTIFAWYAA